MIRKFKNVVVGISGGVDSAVTAYLLKKEGFNVIGVFMKNWDIPDELGYCTADADFEDAQKTCNQLDIPLTQVNFVKEYWNFVFSDLISDYESGYTPNPDILCNRYIKFNHFFRHAIHELGADVIATGHYANSSFGPYLQNYKTNTNVQLLQSKDKRKDQTFFLSQIEQTALKKTMFPIGNFTKLEVREIAKNIGLNVATKPDSTGICFIGNRTFHKFISEYIPDKPGPFIDIETGKKVGEHQGLHLWTLGQGAKLGGNLKPYFIARKEPKSGIIYVAAEHDNPFFYTQIFFTNEPHWIDSNQSFLEKGNLLQCQFRFQHGKPLINCDIYIDIKNNLIVNLEKPLRAITPGQYAVFYLNDQCLGSARILNLGPNMYHLNEFNDSEQQLMAV